MLQYVQDYDERTMECRYPNGHTPPSPINGVGVCLTWCELVHPYLKNSQVLICPSDSTSRPTYSGTGSTGATPIAVWSYGRNYGYFNNTKKCVNDDLQLAEFPKPAETIMLMDTTGCNRGGPRYVDWPADGGTSVDIPMFNNVNNKSHVAFRHNEGMNPSFYDGHCKWSKLGGTPARMYSMEDD